MAPAQARLAAADKNQELMDGLPAGQRLFFWIGEAARVAREDAGISLERIAVAYGGGKEAIDRFEKGRAKPHHLERLLVCYAHLAGLDDPRDIVANAVRLWYDRGDKPELQDGEPASELAQ